jgi:hypothetical protein
VTTITQTEHAASPNAGFSVAGGDTTSFQHSIPTTRLSGGPQRRPSARAASIGRRRSLNISDIRSSYESACRFPASDICCSAGGSVVRPQSKGAKYVLDDASYRGSVHWHGGHHLRVGPTLTGSTTSDCNIGLYPRVCRGSCGRRRIFLMERPPCQSLTAREGTGPDSPRCQSGLTVIVCHERGV